MLFRSVPEENQTTTLSQKLSVNRLRIADQSGDLINEIPVGQSVNLESTVKNNAAKNQKFIYIVLIKDKDGITVLISWLNREVAQSETVDVELPWIPDRAGQYTIDIFLWKSMKNPIPLSSKPFTSFVSVT